MGIKVAGDIISLTATNSEIGNISYDVKSKGDNKFKAGGLKTESSDEGISHAGNPIYQITQTRASYSCVCVDVAGAYKYSVQCGRIKSDTIYVITFSDGRSSTIVGRPVNAIELDEQEGTFTLNIEGRPVTIES